MAVVDEERKVVGTIATSDLIASCRRSVQASLRRVGGERVERSTGRHRRKGITNRRSSLRQATLPKGVLIIAIERGREVDDNAPNRPSTNFPSTGDSRYSCGTSALCLR